MPSLIELFEERAKGCIELADRLEDPNARKLLLETATDWMRGAAALRRAAAKRSPPPNADDDGVRSLSAPPNGGRHRPSNRRHLTPLRCQPPSRRGLRCRSGVPWDPSKTLDCITNSSCPT